MTAAEPAVLEARELTVRFTQRKAGWSGRGDRHEIVAVDRVSLALRRGETLGLVGESGCGKSTLARALLGLRAATSGEVLFDGRDLAGYGPGEMTAFRGKVQIVFQDPFGSLNPRLAVGAALDEVLRVHGLRAGRPERLERVAGLLREVGLDEDHAVRFPHELSGGQRQRVGIARALAVSPEVLVLDEPVSALDVSVRAQVVNLLADLQARRGLTYLFIAHDLALVRHVADRVAVMREGRIVECAPADTLYTRPEHPYTRELLHAIPGVRSGLFERAGGEPRPGPGGAGVNTQSSRV